LISSRQEPDSWSIFFFVWWNDWRVWMEIRLNRDSSSIIMFWMRVHKWKILSSIRSTHFETNRSLSISPTQNEFPRNSRQ
jgi:hypothetical protein